jgi:hypothetical protein
MVRKSRRTKLDKVEYYCRKCQIYKDEKDFFAALDDYLDTNGKMSVCKDCSNEIYNLALNVEMDIKKALFKTCKILNIAFIPECIDSALLQLENKSEGKEIDLQNAFGLYKSKLASYFRLVKNVPRTFESYGIEVKFNEADAKTIEENEGQDFSEYLKNTWGAGLSISDYNFLESSIGEWKRTHKCDTNSELVLMQEICHLQLNIRKTREQAMDTKTLVKSLQELIKTSNLSPAQANLSNATKGTEAFGNWIKDIEQLEPAEWWDKNRNAFVDVDNLAQYFEDFITRPIKNFITRSRDFSIKSGDNMMEVELKESEEDGDS